jgi:hypothetical protein
VLFDCFLLFSLCFLVECNTGREELGGAVFCIGSPKKKFSLYPWMTNKMHSFLQ